MIKTIAMYLPQFHRVPENDKWWGKGFTEWTSVKESGPLFKGHTMPRVPLNDNYYDLMDKETMKWQADLMHKYGVFGMCFYHYYFKNGRKILEKPAENLLEWKDIDIPFCFSWANETWARSWSKIRQANVWALDTEDEVDNTDGILLEQGYGNEADWEQHFMYLLPFFKDERYIKKDGKPVFLVYKADDISCLSEMIEVWSELAIKNGIKPIYILSTNTKHGACDGEVIVEPQYSMRRAYPDKYKRNDVNISGIIDYAELVDKSISFQSSIVSPNIYLSVFPEYDDTPRRSLAGTAVVNSTPKLFQEYVEQVVKISLNNGNDFMFINAWNEWGETMYLEPDMLWGDGYLNAINNAINTLKSYQPSSEYKVNNSIDLTGYEKTIEQYRSYWKLFDNWLKLKEKGISLVDFFHSKGIENIAIYGLGMTGNHLITELKNGPINIMYGIDGKGKAIKESFPVYTLEDDLSQPEIIVVTVTYDFFNIKKKLEDKNLTNIVSLDVIISSLLE